MLCYACSNHGPISYRAETNGNFGRKSQNFRTPRYLTLALKGSLWISVTAVGPITGVMALSDVQKV